MATQTVNAAGASRLWSDGSATGPWFPGSVPAAGDDVVLNATSGNLTIDVDTNAIRSIVETGFTGTVTHNAGKTLNIGGGTAPASNIALVFAGTYTLGDAATSAISIADTSAAINTYDFGGKTLGNVTINNGTTTTTKLVTNGFLQGASALFTLTQGGLDFNGRTCTLGAFKSSNTNTRALTLGAATLTVIGAVQATAWDIGTNTNLTLSAASSTITVSGSGVQFAGGTNSSYGTVNLTGAGLMNIVRATTFVNLNRTGTAVKGDSLALSNNITVTGILTLAGNSVTNRLLVQTANSGPTVTPGTQQTITNSGATMTWSNVDFMDIALGTLYDASAITGKSGDAGGNSNITFTTAAAQTWSGTSGGNWSTNAWTSRVPLPQDDVTIASAFSASQTVTGDMPRLGKSITFAGATGTPTFSPTNATLYGSLTLISGMTLGGAGSLIFAGRSAFTITSAGKQFTNQLQFTAPSGTYTLQDALSTTQNFLHNNGTFDANNFNVTCNQINSNSGSTRTLTMGNGTWTATTTAATSVLNITSAGLTISAASATILVGNASANARTFDGGGKSYGTLTYTVAGSTGALTITGSNTFGTINFSDVTNARTLTFTAGTTTTVTTFNVKGTSGKLMTVNSSSSGSAATLSRASGVVFTDYLSVKDSAATGGATWYAGANSTNVSGNSGWIFTAAVFSLSKSLKYAIVNRGFFYQQLFDTGSIPTGWAEIGNSTWTYNSITATQTTVGSADPNKVLYTGESGLRVERTVVAELTINALSNADDRIGISIHSLSSNGNGVNLVLRNNTDLSFLRDGVAWTSIATIAPNVGETWVFKAKYVGGVYYGKAWKRGTTEPAYSATTLTYTPSGTELYSGIVGNVASKTSKASYDNFLIYGSNPEGTVVKYLRYAIDKPTAITKSLKYGVKITPSALTKSLQYDVFVPKIWMCGWETGTIDEAFINSSTNGVPTVQNTYVRSGGWALRCNGSDCTIVDKPTYSVAALYSRVYVYLRSLPSAENTLLQYLAGAGSFCAVNVNSSGNLVLRNGSRISGTVIGTSSAALSLNTWYRLDLKGTVSATTGILEVRIDGAVAVTGSSLNTGTTNISGLIMGSRPNTMDVVFDDIVTSTDGYSAPGKIIARQPITGTPAYDAWTKTGSDPYWNETPPNNANRAVSTAGTDITQSKLIGPFSSTQSGHGSETISATDAIAAMVTRYAQLQTGGVANTYSEMQRVRGVDVFTPVTLGTVQDVQDGPTTRPIYSDLSTIEAGGRSNGSNSSNYQINDLWVMVDYAPVVQASVTKSLKYTVKIAASALTKSLRYAIDRSTALTKSLKYTVKSPAAALTKSLKYVVKITPAALTKSLKYTVRLTPSALTKSLRYAVKPSVAVTKSLKYTIKTVATALTKSLKYTVTKTPTALTKSLKYIVVIPTVVTKSLRYTVKAPAALTKSLKYTVKTTTTAITKSLRYLIVNKAVLYQQLFGSGSIPAGWVETGNSTWSYTGGVAAQSTIGSADPNKVLYTGADFKQDRVVMAKIKILALDVNEDRVGLSILSQSSDAKGLNLALRGTGGIQGLYFLDDGVSWSPTHQFITPQVGETWWFKARYISGTVEGKAWKDGTAEPAYQISWVHSMGAAFKYSGLLGNVATKVSRAEYDEFHILGANPEGTLIKSLRYAVAAPTPVTKSLKYTVKVPAAAITKSLRYSITGASVALTKSLRYTVKPPVSVTKTLRYTVRSTSAALTKSLKYVIKGPNVISKSLRYILKATAAVTKSLKYVTIKQVSITKSLRYTIRPSYSIPKTLRYNVTVKSAITLSMRYAVVTYVRDIPVSFEKIVPVVYDRPGGL